MRAGVTFATASLEMHVAWVKCECVDFITAARCSGLDADWVAIQSGLQTQSPVLIWLALC